MKLLTIVTRVLTLGTFDCLHHGHIRLFERCAQLGELHVGVNSSAFVRRYKTVEPAQSQDERLWAVANGHGLSDTVVRVYLNDGPGVKLIRRLKPDLLVVGSDWEDNGYLAQIGMDEEEFFGKLGCSLLYVPRTRGVSSTALRAAL